MSEIVERISEYADFKGLSIRQLEIAVGAGNGTISRAIKDKKDIQAKWISIIIDTYPDLNPIWLVTGKPEMIITKGNLILNPDNLHVQEPYTDVIKHSSGNEKGNEKGNLKGNLIHNNQSLPMVITVDNSGNENVLYVPHKASAGYLNGFSDPEYIGTLPAYRLPGLNNGTFRMFEVVGSSMKPTILDHDTVIGLWTNPLDIRDERVYVVVSKEEGIVVKRCINRIQQYGKLILKSDNRDYDDIIILPEDILEVWDVKMKLTYKLPAPAESFYAISDLQARMAMIEDHLKNSSK